MIATGGSPTPPPTPTPVPAEVEYLGITDAYFDTGILASNDLDYELDIEIISSAGGACVFGARDEVLSGAHNHSNNSISVYVNGSGYLALNDKSYDSSYLTGKPSVLNSRHTIKITNRELFVDNTSYVASGKTTTYNYNVSVGLLRMHGLNDSWQGGTNRGISAKVYGFKIYKNSVLVCDLVPNKDGNSVGCFYDRVTRESIYAVTGTVTPGPDINNS